MPPQIQPWLLCIHNIPPKPPYLRAKVARRLAALGAVAVKNSVYALPDLETQRDGLVWLSKEIEQGGGKAFVCKASFDGIEGGGYSDAHIRQLFVDAREADYRNLAAEYQPMLDSLASPGTDEEIEKRVREWSGQLRVRYEEILAIDFFGASGRGAIETMLSTAGAWLASHEQQGVAEQAPFDPEVYRNRVWVTRPGVHVDRIASAWLIKRFIDPAASFRFATGDEGDHGVRFDMVDGEFSHEGALCTFEVLLQRFGLGADSALTILGQIVHDIDLDEDAPARPESAGILALLNGVCLGTDVDEDRISAGSSMLDTLYEHFKRSTQRQL
ncbi:chromate resistance protein ChrB domain-containing protein [Desulfovibrio subterraneus]|uniref:chromate resistance protein ChrB domain-containing protein n=1 Tax=Desulfovibrio subterraneus TaxID=2718620 RepID=UPI001FB17F98|nr:chromate resistance protein ChrB domain-containing protein [Desulfovibrio subterraneus]